MEKDKCTYTQFYCEENVWHLCNHVRHASPQLLNDCYVIFISNSSRMVPLWCQKAGKSADEVVIWDYHVIFIHKSCGSCVVYDLDSTLAFPCTLKEYVKRTLQSEENLKPQYRRMFRVMSGQYFIDNFASDRSHMKADNDTWLRPPPSYPCIKTADATNNINEFISMDPTNLHGEVLDMKNLCNMFLETDGP